MIEKVAFLKKVYELQPEIVLSCIGMKLLLTSAGIRNQTLANGLLSLVEKKPDEVKIGFIPTASNVEIGNKDWYINQLKNFQKYGFNWIDIVDISAPGVNWQSRLESVDVVCFCGGNTFHLLDQIKKTKCDVWLQENLDSKVYLGISAGTIVMTPSIAIASIGGGDVNLTNLTDLNGLTFVDFEISPHTSENVSHVANKEYLKTSKNKLYAIDNETGIKISRGTVEVLSAGQWLLY